MTPILPSLTKLTIDKQILLACQIELLAGCNLRCNHCYVTHETRGRLTLPVLERIFDELVALGTLNLNLSGGEIGLRRDLFAIIAAARQRHFAVGLLSNGTRWGPKEWDRLAALHVKFVSMSLYGVSAAVHEAVTGVAGSHAKTVASLRGLMARGIEVSISNPLMSTNIHEAPKMVELAEEWGVPISLDANITATDRGLMGPKQTVASPEQLAWFYSTDAYRRLKQRVQKPECRPRGKAPQAKMDRPCAIGLNSLSIRCTGEVTLCVSWPGSLGNVLDTPLAEIWYGGALLDFARGYGGHNLPVCQACGDREFCNPCAAMNLQENGAVAMPSATVCDVAAASAIAQRGYSDQPHRRAEKTDRGPGARRLRVVG